MFGDSVVYTNWRYVYIKNNPYFDLDKEFVVL